MNLKKTTQTPLTPPSLAYTADRQTQGLLAKRCLQCWQTTFGSVINKSEWCQSAYTVNQCFQNTPALTPKITPTPFCKIAKRCQSGSSVSDVKAVKDQSGAFAARAAHTHLNTDRQIPTSLAEQITRGDLSTLQSSVGKKSNRRDLGAKGCFNWLLFDNYYRDIISQDFIYKQNYHNIMEVPKIQKLVINSTSKSFTEDRKNITPTLLGLEIICGQKLKISVAKKSIAGFKIREGQTIGCKVTLRKHCISYFLDKLRLVILPRFGNFTGCSVNSFDKQANYTLGLNDLLLFPELEAQFELFENLAGINLSFVMCKKKQSENLLLLSALQLPIQKK